MARKRTAYGKTAGGKPITDELVADLAEKAETGYDVDETLRRRPGRPPLGSAPASVESVRLEPELREALSERAKRDRETPSSVIRKALRRYLEVR
ncbi:MAG: CopG family transcriptional regulator [Actinomycetota bacterium]